MHYQSNWGTKYWLPQVLANFSTIGGKTFFTWATPENIFQKLSYFLSQIIYKVQTKGIKFLTKKTEKIATGSCTEE